MNNNQEALTMYGGTCSQDGARMKFVRCDGKAVYFECECCGHKARYVFADEEEAKSYLEGEMQQLLGKLRVGMADWERAQWDNLYKEFVNFTIQYPDFEQDIQIQMAYIACITRGYNMIDAEKYKQCKTMFSVAEKAYKAQLKLLKQQSRGNALPSDIADYQSLRQNYVHLRNQYLQTKIMCKMFWSVLRLILK